MESRTYAEMHDEAIQDDQIRVFVERNGDRAVVRLHHPEKLNMLGTPMMHQLRAHLSELIADPGVKTVVLTGEPPAFSAGGDLELMRFVTEHMAEGPEGATDIWRYVRYEYGATVRMIARSDTAFIAAINGAAAGVGLAFALSCDMVLASADAVIVPAFGRLGLLPEVGTSWALTRALGYRGAFRYYVSGRHLTAEQAAEAGLVDEVVPAAELIPTAMKWCDRIGKLPDHALRMGKPLLRNAADLSWDQSLAAEEYAQPMTLTTRAFADAVKGLLDD